MRITKMDALQKSLAPEHIAITVGIRIFGTFWFQNIAFYEINFSHLLLMDYINILK